MRIKEGGRGGVGEGKGGGGRERREERGKGREEEMLINFHRYLSGWSNKDSSSGVGNLVYYLSILSVSIVFVFVKTLLVAKGTIFFFSFFSFFSFFLFIGCFVISCLLLLFVFIYFKFTHKINRWIEFCKILAR